jgi:restriction system protein
VTSTTGTRGPKVVAYFWPLIQALKDLGGSARPPEVGASIARSLNLSEEVLAETLPSGLNRFYNEVAFARLNLVKAGLIDSSSRGVWTLTEKGRQLEGLSHGEALQIFREVRAKLKESKDTEEAGDLDESGVAPSSDRQGVAPEIHRERVLDVLRGLPPAGFERFCQRLLRESGFEEVTVTGRSGDGGIDGLGILQLSPLVSFKVLFQCKRYAGTVTTSQVRDFRGAMQGRADKGIMLTTGTFTSDAKREAVRDGAPPIEMVDAEKLIDMMEQLQLGLKPVRSFEVDESFFDEFKS